MPALVVVPTYNEATGIDTLLDRVLAADPSLNILVVDDGSPDGTGDMVAARGRDDCRIELLSRASKLGLGKAYVAGFRRGLLQGYERLVEMDADLSHDPADLPRLIALTDSHDLVIGSRYVTGGQVQGWSRSRHMLSRSANAYARALLGMPVKDSTSGFRCYRREVLDALDLSSVSSEGYAFQVEMAYRTWKAGFRVAETPITFKERASGESKMSRQIVLEGMVWVTGTGLKRLTGSAISGRSPGRDAE